MRTVAVLAVLASLTSGMLYLENRAIKQALSQVDQGYIEFMSRKLKGKTMAHYIKPDSVGLFKVGDEVVACGMLHQGLTSGLEAKYPKSSKIANTK